MYANTAVCFERIKKRNRKGEDLIPLEYLEMCHSYHEKWIMNNQIKHKMIINGNENHNENKNQLNTWVKEFEAFLLFYNDYFIKPTSNYFFNSKSISSKNQSNIVKI